MDKSNYIVSCNTIVAWLKLCARNFINKGVMGVKKFIIYLNFIAE